MKEPNLTTTKHRQRTGSRRVAFGARLPTEDNVPVAIANAESASEENVDGFAGRIRQENTRFTTEYVERHLLNFYSSPAHIHTYTHTNRLPDPSAAALKI